ncbi:MAG: glycosyltransferase family 2 protein [Chitinophagaceae bacterium]
MAEQEISYPLITVVIPTWNAQSVLDTAIQSVLLQDFLDWEMVIVDGASSDDTVNIIRKYIAEDNRISFISEKDEGVYDAMNKGIKLAKGAWIYFLGSDDKLFSEKALSDVSLKLQSASGWMVYGNVRMGDDVKNYDGPFDFGKLLTKNIPHQATFYNKKIFDKYGYYELRYRQHADWAFNIKCFRHVEPLYIDVLVGVFGLGGISGAHDKLFLQEVLIPEKMRRVEAGGGRELKNIRSYDIIWRMIRNAAFKNEQAFLNVFAGIEMSLVVRSMFRFQQTIPFNLLSNGFISKTSMMLNYLYNRIIFRL